MGAVIYGAIALYAFALLALVLSAYRFARRRGFGRKRRVALAVVVFFAGYLPLFWDHIPTVVAHEYYCQKEAGIWVFKTPEQWVTENADALRAIHRADYLPGLADPQAGVTREKLSSRFSRETVRSRLTLLPLTITRRTILDTHTDVVLARQVSVVTGYGTPALATEWHDLKFWLSSKSCAPGLREFSNLTTQYRDIGGGR
ncbi:MAG TPA: hypothetical protein VEB41_13295 [Burkholderiales bacterium]|nr:hypothetical protein [Burkholderiales bacterium]